MAKIEDFDENQRWEDEQLSRENAVARLGKVQVAMQMKISGADWPEIAGALGYGTAEAAARDVHRALEEELLNNDQMSTEVLRMIELKRLNTIYQGLVPGVERGNARSSDIAVKVSDRISALMGLNAPTKTQTQVEIDIRSVTVEIERTKREIAARRAELESSGVIVDADVVNE